MCAAVAVVLFSCKEDKLVGIVSRLPLCNLPRFEKCGARRVTGSR